LQQAEFYALPGDAYSMAPPVTVMFSDFVESTAP
jgi:hypothetical protein